MKLRELLLTQEDQENTKLKKLSGLKDDIANGESPEIHNATYTIVGPAWGDLERLGMAHREQQDQQDFTYSERWVYTGPGPITLIKSGGKRQIMNQGDATNWVEVDVS